MTIDWSAESEALRTASISSDLKEYRRKVRELAAQVPPEAVETTQQAVEERLERGLDFTLDNPNNKQGKQLWTQLLHEHALIYFVARFQRTMLEASPSWAPWSTPATPQTEQQASLHV